MWISLVVAGCLAAGVIACGSTDSGGSDQPDDTPAALGGEAKPIEVPELTERQEAEAVAILKADPLYREITAGLQPEVGSVGEWTRPNQELLGAAVEVRFGTPGDFERVEWPTIENKDELYGEGWEDEAGSSGEVEPDIEPQIGTTDVNASEVTRIVVSVDLEQGRIAEIWWM